jgi:hypothetical protein
MVRTTSLGNATTVLEIRWPQLEAPSAWLAGRRAIESLEQAFPAVIAAPFLRVDVADRAAQGRPDRFTRRAPVHH